MAKFTHEFKVQSVEKTLSRRRDQTVKNIADDLGVGCSTLQKWIRLAKDNKLENPGRNMSKERSPQDWNKPQRFEAVMDCHNISDEKISAYCRENGIYPHHLSQWKAMGANNGWALHNQLN